MGASPGPQQTIEVAALPITINGIESRESPGLSHYLACGGRSQRRLCRSAHHGSAGVYFDAQQDFHMVEFRTTWSVPGLKTVFIWNNTDPFGGPYSSPIFARRASATPTPGVAGEPPPGGDTPTGGPE